ncbi:hypothetical protein EYF80_032509 [Liparis tanakae]|uniref:Uncharacterized protein n=1 Tax=Liparis tanakae TaxID=230148 RepID=A0A4Z2GVJ2_9TELE|nr:hypothetical protein EYF80_032509 [Liparis tanakae]
MDPAVRDELYLIWKADDIIRGRRQRTAVKLDSFQLPSKNTGSHRNGDLLCHGSIRVDPNERLRRQNWKIIYFTQSSRRNKTDENRRTHWVTLEGFKKNTRQSGRGQVEIAEFIPEFVLEGHRGPAERRFLCRREETDSGASGRGAAGRAAVMAFRGELRLGELHGSASAER